MLRWEAGEPGGGASSPPRPPAGGTPRSLGAVVGGAVEEGPGRQLSGKQSLALNVFSYLLRTAAGPQRHIQCAFQDTKAAVHIHLPIDLRLEMSPIHPREHCTRVWAFSTWMMRVLTQVRVCLAI